MQNQTNKQISWKSRLSPDDLLFKWGKMGIWFPPCGGLNVVSPTKFLCRNTNSQCEGGVTFGRWLGHEGWPLITGFTPLVEETPESPLTLLLMRRLLSVNQEVGPHQSPNLPASWSWTSSLQNDTTQISIVYRLPCRADKTLPANAGDTGSIPDPRRFHVPRSSEAPEPQLLSLHSIPHEPQLLKAEPASNPLSATREAPAMRSPSTTTRE